MKRALLSSTVLLILATAAPAAEWANIEPGVTTLQQVQELFGKPTKETRAKVEGYDTIQWIFERAEAPKGITRMVVDFGLLAADGYKPTVVRLLKLEPNPWVFGRGTVIDGWGPPDAIGKGEGVITFVYKDGLFVTFDKDGQQAFTLIFSIPQPDAIPTNLPRPAPSAPAAAPSGPAPAPPSAPATK